MDVQVVYSAAPFWEGNARCLVRGFVWDARVNEGAEAAKPLFPPVEVRILLYAAGGLLRHRHSLYNDEENIFPTASSLELL